MTLHIYFHRDFDGVVSATILTVIMKKLKYFNEFKYYPVDYNIKDDWIKHSLIIPAGVVDFLFHPDATYYYDHHSTSFESDECNFAQTKFKRWDSSSKSAASLIAGTFFEDVDLEEFQDMVKWADTIDSAEYASPSDVYDYNNKYLILSKIAGQYANEDSILVEMIESIVNGNIVDFLSNYEHEIFRLISQELDSLKALKEKLSIKGNVCLFDQGESNMGYQRFLPYYYYPDLDYVVGIYPSDKNYKISLGYNPWKTDNVIDLGKEAKKFGGGGRMNVAGIVVNDYRTALDVAKALIKRLGSKQLTRT